MKRYMPTVTTVEDGLENYYLEECAQGVVCKWEEVQAAIAEHEATILAQQARIDALMLEYCPDEMSETQMATWAAMQQVITEAEYKEVRAKCLEELAATCDGFGEMACIPTAVIRHRAAEIRDGK